MKNSRIPTHYVLLTLCIVFLLGSGLLSDLGSSNLSRMAFFSGNLLALAAACSAAANIK